MGGVAARGDAAWPGGLELGPVGNGEPFKAGERGSKENSDPRYQKEVCGVAGGGFQIREGIQGQWWSLLCCPSLTTSV